MEPWNIHPQANPDDLRTEAFVSIAVSLKRIADMMQDKQPQSLTMQRALERIGDLESCGCACTSVCQCNSQESLAIWKQEVREIARAALPA